MLEFVDGGAVLAVPEFLPQLLQFFPGLLGVDGQLLQLLLCGFQFGFDGLFVGLSLLEFIGEGVDVLQQVGFLVLDQLLVDLVGGDLLLEGVDLQDVLFFPLAVAFELGLEVADVG